MTTDVNTEEQTTTEQVTEKAPETTEQFDWRKEAAGEDEKLYKNLARYTTLGDFAKSKFERDRQISSGEYIRKLPENADEETINQWRKEMGIPETPDYGFKLEQQKEEDKVFMDEFYQVAHENNVPPAFLEPIVKFMFESREKNEKIIKDAEEKRDTEYKAQADETLRTLWGKDYHPNMNIIGNFTAGMTAEQKQIFEGARTADGNLLVDHPDFKQFLAKTARTINPAVTIVPNTDNPKQAVESELAEMDKRMSTPNGRKEIMNNPKLWDRYKQLNAAAAQLSKMGGEQAA